MADVVSRDVRVLATVLRRLLRAERVSPASLSMGTGLTRQDAEEALGRLDAAGILYLEDGIVRAAYPLSGVPTRHRLGIGEAPAYANCAFDALAISAMVDEPVRIESECAQCGEAVVVQMGGDRVLAAQPAAPVVLYVAPGECCEPGPAVLTRCPSINFFCDDGHAAQWQAAHPEEPGRVFPLADAIPAAHDRFAVITRLVRDGDIPPTVFSDYAHWLASGRG